MLKHRFHMRFAKTTLCFLATLALSPLALAQTGSIPEQIESAYTLTKPTADLTSIVKPGDTLVLKKDNLVMCGVVSALPSYNTYRNGSIGQSLLNHLKFFTASGNAPTVPTRTFVAGENVLLTGVEITDKGLQLTLLSQAVDGIRYKAFLVFPYPASSPPSPAEALQEVAQVLSVKPVDNTPKPTAGARTVSLGQTKEQVTAVLGQPTTVVNLGAKEVYYFPNMRVTFVNGHVADVQ